jgi:hypothetical protein
MGGEGNGQGLELFCSWFPMGNAMVFHPPLSVGECRIPACPRQACDGPFRPAIMHHIYIINRLHLAAGWKNSTLPAPLLTARHTIRAHQRMHLWC